MKRLLFLISVLCLCLSSNVFGQQPRPRANYYYYGVDAGPENVIQVQVSNPLTVRFLDDSNFQKYQDGRQDVVTTAGALITTAAPYHIVPPKEQHWYVVIENRGLPFSANVVVRLFSDPKGLEQKKQ